jgi:hypothetical protein
MSFRVSFPFSRLWRRRPWRPAMCRRVRGRRVLSPWPWSREAPASPALTRKPYPLSFLSSLFLHEAGGGSSGDLKKHRRRRREEISAIDRSYTHSCRIGMQQTRSASRSPSPRHGRDPGCVAAQAGRPAGDRARGEARRQHRICLAASGNKAPGAGAGELAGARWRRIAGRPSPARPRQGEAAATPLSSVSPFLRPDGRLVSFFSP